jgi:predicted membrane GTPase involved in stress response
MLPFTNVRQSVTDEAVCLITRNALTLESAAVFIEEKLH